MNNKFDASSSPAPSRLKDEDSDDDNSADPKVLQTTSKTPDQIKAHPPEPGPGEHRLQFTYAIWFSRRTPGRQATSQSYDQNLRLIGTFNTVERFWAFYCHLVRPQELVSNSDYHLFKEGIKPMWEDEANKEGGHWIIRFKKGLASRCWENLILAILGEQFMVGEEICGAVISVRAQEDIVSVWNKTASDQITTIRIRDTLRRVLNLPSNTIMEYKTHAESLSYIGWRRPFNEHRLNEHRPVNFRVS